MKLTLPFPEALAVATSERPLPPVIRSLRCEDATLHAEIDLDAIPIQSFALRLAAAAAGTMTVTARFAGFSAGVATFVITAHARGLPAHKLLPYLLDPVDKAMRDSGLPEGLLEIQRGESDPLVLVDVQKAIEIKASGVSVTHLDLLDAVFHVEAAVGAVKLH